MLRIQADLIHRAPGGDFAADDHPIDVRARRAVHSIDDFAVGHFVGLPAAAAFAKVIAPVERAALLVARAQGNLGLSRPFFVQGG